MVFVKHNFCRLSCPNHFTFSRGSVCFLTSDDLFISHWRNVCEAFPKDSFQVALPLYCDLFSCLYLLCCWIHVSFFAASLSSFANGAYNYFRWLFYFPLAECLQSIYKRWCISCLHTILWCVLMFVFVMFAIIWRCILLILFVFFCIEVCCFVAAFVCFLPAWACPKGKEVHNMHA